MPNTQDLTIPLDVDALDLAGVVGQQRLEGVEIVALHDQVAGFGIPGGLGRIAVQQAIRHFLMVMDDSVLAYPIECRHVGIVSDRASYATPVAVVFVRCTTESGPQWYGGGMWGAS